MILSKQGINSVRKTIFWLILMLGISIINVNCLNRKYVSSETIFSLDISLMNGSSFSSSKLRQNKGTVFIFLTPDCPIAQKSISKLKIICNKYHSSAFEFYGVFTDFLVNKESAQVFSDKYDLVFPIINDEKRTLADYFGATISPEVFIIDNVGSLRYQGQIDNWFFEIGKKRSQVTEQYLIDALKSISKGEVVSVKHTKAVGCFLPKKK